MSLVYDGYGHCFTADRISELTDLIYELKDGLDVKTLDGHDNSVIQNLESIFNKRSNGQWIDVNVYYLNGKIEQLCSQLSFAISCSTEKRLLNILQSRLKTDTK